MPKPKKIFFISILIMFVLVLPTLDAAHAVEVNATIKVGMFPEGVAYDSN